jgi:pterin-4a-carbinolamine dehydratase
MTMETVVIRKKTAHTIELRRVPRPGGSGDPAAEGGGMFLKPERVQEWLQAQPEWRLHADGKSLHRVRAFPSMKVATRYGAFVTALAEALGQPMRVSLADGKVDLSLYSCHEGESLNPLTENVLTLAAHLG